MAALHLNHKQFEKMMGEGKTLLVDFWAPWCSYCRRIDPAYEKVAEQYGENLVVPASFLKKT